ncbi:Protein of unknown function [Amycolatopsis arida]|uniref:DUF1360 domain-containing protein n=1 Tax=Amycolatopsis arida TaxID=587909 RepID=A0A1I5LQW5_9PSEU|nr:DUF1360 domain-containing protein [Amycolatopsis arida]TDX93805.1 uncharacterized protein DUF1360 [Amycolatopsis arida]SFO99557.1 Protein of unknown function [Amycolatopsis arida]
MSILARTGRRIRELYQGDADRPLRGYLVVLGTYGGLAAALTAGGRALGVRLPERIGLGDTVLLSVATHKASRVLAKDTITSPLRAPFTRYEAPAGESELQESVRGDGAQHAIGEMITCPFCLGVWIATGLTAGMVAAPRPTRLVSTVLTVVAAADVLQIGYDMSKQLLTRAARAAHPQ